MDTTVLGKRKHTIIDVDGVIVDTAMHSYATFGKEAWLDEVTSYDKFFGVILEKDPAGAARMMEAWTTGAFWSGLPLREGVAAAMEIFRRNQDVTIATVPYPKCPDWIATRQAYLLRHASAPRGGDCRLLVDYRVDKASLDADVMVEDNAETLAKWWQPGRMAIIIDHPWNRGAAIKYPTYRVKTLIEAAYLAHVRSLHVNDRRIANMNITRPTSVVRCDRGSPFGNPFRIGSDGDRLEVLAKYARSFDDKIAHDKSFVALVEQLRGQRLGCWCTPQLCHTQVILEYLDRTAKRAVPLDTGSAPT